MQYTDLEILFEDNHLLVINKPAGVLVQPDKNGDVALEQLVKEYIKHKYNKPGDVFIGVCHRIDRPVSGAVVFARTSKALVRMNEMFKTKEVDKTYWAAVEQCPPEEEGHLVHWLKKDERQNTSRAYGSEVKGALKSELDYRLATRTDKYYLVEIRPHTGRHHQIRVQFSTVGCPIKGDVKYGARRGNRNGSIHLHARKIEFIHPVKKKKYVLKPLPPTTPFGTFLAD